MKKARYTSSLVILILLASLITWPRGQAITPQDQTISIVDTLDDKFITEAGVGIDAWLCHILDPAMDIRSYLVFRELEINWWEPLENATLRLRTTVNLDFEADSSVTVYGMKFSDLQDEGIIGPSFVLSVPYTSASVDVNTSQFYGQVWHEIDVTSIVEELIRSYDWDGDGHDGTEIGDSIGFVIVGAEGHDTRWFVDYHYGTPSLASQLVIHWNHEPPPPVEGSTFVKVHGDNYTIWYYETYEEIELIYHQSTTLRYHNSTTGPDGSIDWAGAGFQPSSGGHMEKMAILDEWVLIIGDNGSTKIYYSDDEFSEGSIKVSEPNNQFAQFNTYAGNHGSIVLDQKDNQTFHVVWSTVTPWQTGTYNVVYSNFTILDNGSLNWSSDYVNITNVGTEQFEPDIYCQKNGTLHLTWWGHQATTHDQVWYMRRYANGTWGSQVRVTDTDANDWQRADVVANEDTGNALITYSMDSATIYWDLVFPNNTDGPDRSIATGYGGAIVNDRDNNVVHLVYHHGIGDVDYKYKSIDNSSAWSAKLDISPSGEKHKFPTISINEDNDTLAVIWNNEWNEQTAYNFWQIGATPIVGKTTINNVWFTHPNQPNNHERYIEWVYIIVDENGTNVANTTSLGDAEDWIDTEDPDPEDPDPGGEWSDYPGGETGAFTRFRMRLWFLLIGFGCLFGPILFFAWRRPSGYYILCGAIVMLIGIGMLLSIGQV